MNKKNEKIEKKKVVKWRVKKKNLGRELSAEKLRDEDSVGVHEMVKIILNAVYENRFHGDLIFLSRFRILREKWEEEGEESEELNLKMKCLGFFLGFGFFLRV